MEKGNKLKISPNEVLGLPDIQPATHEFATLLQFGTSYELVDWLAKQLQFSSELLEQEHKDWEMIQNAMLGDLEPEEERELQRIGRQREAKKKEMSSLNTTLVESH